MLREFAAAREWDQYHTPKNLAAAMSVEAAEVLEHFQWLTDEQSLRLSTRRGGLPFPMSWPTCCFT